MVPRPSRRPPANVRSPCNTAYLGLIPALTTPALVLGAALCGPAIDAYGFMPVTAASLALGLVAAWLSVFKLPEPRYSLAGKRKP